MKTNYNHLEKCISFFKFHFLFKNSFRLCVFFIIFSFCGQKGPLSILLKENNKIKPFGEFET